MFNYNFFFILFIYFITISTEQNLSNTYNITNRKIIKKKIKNFIIDYNFSLTETKEIIFESKNKNDFFILNNQTYIIFPSNNKELSNYAEALTIDIKNYTNFDILVAPNVIRKTSNRNKNTFIQIVLDKTLKKIFQIEINKRKIKLLSKTNLGIKRAIKVFKIILEKNFQNNSILYENIKFPLNNIYMNETNNNIKIIILIITSLLIIYMSFHLIKSKI